MIAHDVPVTPPAIVITGNYVNPNPIFIQPRDTASSVVLIPSDSTQYVIVQRDNGRDWWRHDRFDHRRGLVSRLLGNLL